MFQHFDKRDARAAIQEMSRVTGTGGKVLVQMPDVFGLRQALNAAPQRFKDDSNPFRVRYWRPRELKEVFERLVGPSELSVDGFFSLNPQATDVDLLPSRYAWLVRASEALRTISRSVPSLGLVADSLYVESANAHAFRTSGAH